MKIFGIAFFILFLNTGLVFCETFSPVVPYGNLISPRDYFSSRDLSYNLGFMGSSNGEMYSWAGVTKSFMPSQNLFVDIDLSLVRHFGDHTGNYLMSGGKMTYLVNDKITLNVSFVAPAIKLDKNSDIMNSW
ncbi:hypothetical protein JXA84_02995 [candidate division WOR-3 bacterium]|nr:hypothetical protein [candidate division WOR-3 bacterium]